MDAFIDRAWIFETTARFVQHDDSVKTNAVLSVIRNGSIIQNKPTLKTGCADPVTEEILDSVTKLRMWQTHK